MKKSIHAVTASKCHAAEKLFDAKHMQQLHET